MSRAMIAPAEIRTLADLRQRLGGIPLERIGFHPAPGTATEQDVVEVEARENRLCELVDGTLVEKAMGFEESRLAAELFTSGQILSRPERPGDLRWSGRHDANRSRPGADSRSVVHHLGQAPRP
jgi:hypothetical protein